MGDGNATVSTLTYSPKPEDHGRLLACQAHVEGLPGSIVEDSRRLWVQCKWFSILKAILGNIIELFSNNIKKRYTEKKTVSET